MSILATKRRLAELEYDNSRPASVNACRSEYAASVSCRASKRSRRVYTHNNSNDEGNQCKIDVSTLLNADNHAFQLSTRRLSLLESLRFTQDEIIAFFTGLGSDISAFLRIIDVNLWKDSVIQVVGDYANRGVPLVRLNIQGHSFSMGPKQQVIKSFDAFHPTNVWPRNVLKFVADVLFKDDEKISVSVFSGGGIRDILLADWCRLHNLVSSEMPPQLIVITAAPSNRTFFVPFIPASV